MTEQLFSIRDCGKAVGVAPHQIAYAHAQERLAEPQYRVAGKRIYTAEDVAMVAKYFAAKSRNKGGKDSDGD
jgi:DNA-binding transcriptional MerR regulator